MIRQSLIFGMRSLVFALLMSVSPSWHWTEAGAAFVFLLLQALVLSAMIRQAMQALGGTLQEELSAEGQG